MTWGAGDFMGGLATRRSRSAIPVVIGSQLVGLLLVVILLLFAGGELFRRDVGWAAAAAISGSGGLLLLYRGLATGTMTVVAPVSAVLAAIVPLCWGLATGERPSVLSWFGVVIALVAVALVSGAGRGFRVGPALGKAFGAGIGFGVFFILIANTSSAELWVIALARTTSILVIGCYGLVVGTSMRLPVETRWLVVGSGLGDAAGNVLFLLAERRGLLALVAVITSLYPAGTVLLARLFLREQLSRTQLIGLGLAALGIALISGG